MTTALHTFSSQIIGVSDRDINVNSEATQIRDLDVAKASYSDDVRITTAKLCGLTWFQVYVRGVLACEAMSEAGARACARNYIKKLARV
jgi:hypothetical protein